MKNRLFSRALKFAKDKKGASMVEYAVVIGLITALSIATVTAIGTDIKNGFVYLEGQISGNKLTGGGV